MIVAEPFTGSRAVLTQAPVEVRQVAQGSIVNQVQPVIRGTVNFVNRNPTNEVKESFIQNRVINSQINQQNPVFVQPQQQAVPQNVVIQQQPVQNPIFVDQQVISNQPAVIRIQGQQTRQINFNGSQQGVWINQQQQNQEIVQQGQPISVVRTSNISFQGPQIQAQVQPQVQGQPLQQMVSTPYQATKTNSVYMTPQPVNKEEPQREESNKAALESNSPTKRPVVNEAFSSNQPSMRLRNNEESISSITAKTNPVQSNEIISDKFSMMKEEPIDNSTRNFYTDMLNNN